MYMALFSFVFVCFVSFFPFLLFLNRLCVLRVFCLFVFLRGANVLLCLFLFCCCRGTRARVAHNRARRVRAQGGAL